MWYLFQTQSGAVFSYAIWCGVILLSVMQTSHFASRSEGFQVASRLRTFLKGTFAVGVVFLSSIRCCLLPVLSGVVVLPNLMLVWSSFRRGGVIQSCRWCCRRLSVQLSLCGAILALNPNPPLLWLVFPATVRAEYVSQFGSLPHTSWVEPHLLPCRNDRQRASGHNVFFTSRKISTSESQPTEH